jgi:hypothetical protein
MGVRMLAMALLLCTSSACVNFPTPGRLTLR